MLTNQQFIQTSLINNLFYLRTLRYFCINIQLSFYQNNERFIKDAESLGQKCEELGREIIQYADYELLKFAIQSSILSTKYTLECERLTEKLFDVKIATDITEQELQISPGVTVQVNEQTVNAIQAINQKAYVLTQNFITFCEEVRTKMLANELFSYSYPAMYDYMIEEAERYELELERIMKRDTTSPIFVLNFEYQFNNVMREGAMFIRGLVDPNQEEIIKEADQFVTEFQTLMKKYQTEGLSPEKQKELTMQSLDTLNRFIAFIERCIEGQLNSSIYFIVEPIFLDNLYSEANYFKYALSINRLAEESF